MHVVPAVLVSVALASCTLATTRPPAGPPPQEGACCELYPAARGDLVLDVPAGGAPLTLAEIARRYAELTGQHLVLSQETASLLETSGPAVPAPVTVPADGVQSFFEQLLRAHDYALHALRGDAPRLVVIESLRTQARATVRDSAVVVPAERLAHFTRHPATLVSAVVHLPNTDVRQLSNAMRTLITDANTQQMLPAGTTNAVVLTGFGAQVAGLAEMLHTVDANSGPQRQLAVLRLQHADARWVGNALQIVLGTPRAGGEDAPSPPERFRIATDERINALVVAADPATMADIERLVAELDVAAE